METPKYYQPNIEEFHVGFEFEILNTEGFFFIPSKETGTWNKTLVHNGIFTNLENIEKLLFDKQIRVKHLDREDIESLGLVFRNSFRDKEVYDEYYFLGGFLQYWCNSQTILIESDGHERRGNFIGTIKNKSELKRLMQQLNILDSSEIETQHLLSTKANRDRLNQSIEQAKKNDTKEYDGE